jgi:quercetin dioxygenase-like cupin family protein
VGTDDSFAAVGSLPSQEIWPGVVARSVHGDRTTLALVELAPGTAVPEHAHDNEQIGVLLSGTMTFTIAGETRELETGATWRIRSFVPHSVVAGTGGAVAAELFTPVRDDWATIESRPPSRAAWPA